MINKFQQGGKQNAIMQFVQGLAQVMQVDPNLIVLIAQLNPDVLELAVQTYLQTQDMNLAALAFQLALQLKTQTMKHGAKLQYLKSLKHQCPEGEELYYYKKGGSVGCGCKKKEEGGEVQEAKCGAVAKFKAIRKAETGTTIKKETVKNSNRKETVINGSTKLPTIDGTRKAYEKFKKELAKKKAQLKRDEQSLKDYEEGTYGETGNPPDSPAMSKEHIKKTEGKTYTSIRHSKSLVMKCGSKMKKKEDGGIIEKFKIAFRNGGSLNHIPFMLAGTPNGGIKRGINGEYYIMPIPHGASNITGTNPFVDILTTNISNNPYLVTGAPDFLPGVGGNLGKIVGQIKKLPIGKRGAIRTINGKKVNILDKKVKWAKDADLRKNMDLDYNSKLAGRIDYSE